MTQLPRPSSSTSKFLDGLAAGARGSKQAVRDCAGGKRAREATARTGWKRKWKASARGRQARAQDARARAECDGARAKRQLEMQLQKVQKRSKSSPGGFNIDPRRLQNRSLEPSWRPSGAEPPPGGSPEASRSGSWRLFGPSWRYLGRPWLPKRLPWARPGGSWAALGALRAALGAVLALLGRP